MRAKKIEFYAAAGADAPGWYFGQRLRDRGSLHSDIWEGTAADLASRHAIAVYPTGGWWREKTPPSNGPSVKCAMRWL